MTLRCEICFKYVDYKSWLTLLLLSGLMNNPFDVGINVLVGRMEISNDDSQGICSFVFSRSAKTFLYVFDLRAYALSQIS